MLLDEIKKRMMAAMKSGDIIAKEVLRTAVGEITMSAERRTGPQGDELATLVLRKLVKSNQETLSLSTDAAQQEDLRREIEVVESMLPKGMGIEEVVAALEPSREAIRSAANDGQATGVAMKALKALGAVVQGRDVTEAVKRIRAATHRG